MDPRPKHRTSLTCYLVVGVPIVCLCTLALAFAAYYHEWEVSSGGLTSRQELTVMELQVIGWDIEDYRSRHQQYPRSLDTFWRQQHGWIEKDVAEGRINTDRQGRLLDGWGRPYYYQQQGNKFVLGSFGRDGNPGGRGVDADLGGSTPNELSSVKDSMFPDFYQFVTTRDNEEIKGSEVSNYVVWSGSACALLFINLEVPSKHLS